MILDGIFNLNTFCNKRCRKLVIYFLLYGSSPRAKNAMSTVQQSLVKVPILQVASQTRALHIKIRYTDCYFVSFHFLCCALAFEIVFFLFFFK